MTLEFLKPELSVCKYKKPVYPVGGLFFTGNTDREFSLVCETALVPDGYTDREDGWKAFRIDGQLDFSLVGILAPIAGILAEERICIFALSTFDTDYILIKKENEKRAASALEKNGYIISTERCI
ncbi:MAG: ACT domain-containing protein [Clostridia bacterium]|nr:ACT domain-containing protein [Clostridia bacterium]